tara:strand:- start:436 stop:879 length:444 start_codon:yes stop_codon:yes gene_type:complete
MVITTDFNIFADKYHNKQHLPYDMITMIMNINTDIIKQEKENKKKFNIVVKTIGEYTEFIKEEGDDEESIYIMLEIRKENALDDFIYYKNKKEIFIDTYDDDDDEDEQECIGNDGNGCDYGSFTYEGCEEGWGVKDWKCPKCKCNCE